MEQELARSGLVQLRDVHGVHLDPIADLDHIQKIIALAGLVKNPPGQSAAVLDPVRVVGNLTLHRLTMGAKECLAGPVRAWFSGQTYWQNVALAFLMVHGKDPQRIWQVFATADTCAKSLKDWIRNVGCTYRALVTAMDEFMASEVNQDLEDLLRTKPEDDQPEDLADEALEMVRQRELAKRMGWLFEVLVNQYGHTCHFWAWEAADVEIQMLLDQYLGRKEREDRQQAAASMQAVAPNPNSPHIRALKAFRDYVARVAALKKVVKP